MRKKVLFLLEDHHTSELNLYPPGLVGSILSKSDFEVTYILHHKNSLKLLPANSEVFLVKMDAIPNVVGKYYNRFNSDLQVKPLFWESKDPTHWLMAYGYLSSDGILKQFNKFLKIIKRWKPDIIIGVDHHLASPLGKRLNIPVLQIDGHINFNNGPVNNKPDNSEIHPAPVIESLFSDLFAEIQQVTVKNYEELFSGDGYIIAGIEELEPLQIKSPHIYLGHRLKMPWDERLLAIDKKNRKKKIFINLQRANEQVNLQKYYDFFLNVFQGSNMHFIMADSSGYVEEQIINLRVTNFSTFKWIESPQAFPFLDAVIHDGSMKNILDTLYRGIPFLIIPLNSEGERRGRRVEEIAAGKMLKLAGGPYQPVKIHLPSVDLSISCGFEITVKPEELRSKLEGLLDNKMYQDKCVYYSQKLKDQFQPEEIVKFIQGFM